ncbi:MAG: alpha-amylase family glycosyl hydrolase [Clostridia bacterium]|nr:alpha-amylase family glycosyl hydrolase [Clostridia bacterium]MDD4047587.1 alpha-amylase family glycosyl hydrolase [Clostridia bacterium]
MRHEVRIHYDNANAFLEPVLWVWVTDGATLEREVAPSGIDDFGVYYDIVYNRSSFNFLFKDGTGSNVRWEDNNLARSFKARQGNEVWVMADRHNVYIVYPAKPVGYVNDYYNNIRHLVPTENYYLPDTDVSGLSVVSMLGANILNDGTIVFGFFHPRAARVYLVGKYNNLQSTIESPNPYEDNFIEMKLYRGFYYQPNIWIARVKPQNFNDVLEYKFFIQGGTGEDELYITDPYTRVYSDDYKYSNGVVINPMEFRWTDKGWETHDIKDLILYELNVYGFTDNDDEIPEEVQGTFKGVTRRIQNGYFEKLGITALALMPTAEVPTKEGLGYEPCTFMAVEKDFGTPNDFKEMVNEAHKHGLTVIMDQVFNHTSNEFNPLWNLIDDGTGSGGFYFAGETMWGNKVATGKDEVDNMLIDSCKLFIKEYHIDGFRFDATHSYFIDHKLLHRLTYEIKDKGFKTDVILIAENLPNEQDLNRQGYNGYAQWSNIFHDKVKALLREGEFENTKNDTNNLAAIFYFSKEFFAAHTNNVINYCESHDENSVQFEVATGGEHLNDPYIKDRKARLGLMSTMVALGQPMIYMGQELGVERERNRIKVPWKTDSEASRKFYDWSCGLINLRKKYDALKLSGYNPADEGLLSWVIGSWMDEKRGSQQRVIGWRINDRENGMEKILVMLNFENHDVTVDVDFHTPGKWSKLADLEGVYDYSKAGNDEATHFGNIEIESGLFDNFVLPPYSGYIYKL